jgi:hypothetical protein
LKRLFSCAFALKNKRLTRKDTMRDFIIKIVVKLTYVFSCFLKA